MPSHKYEKPKSRVIEVYRGKELEGLVKRALERMFSGDGVKITPKKASKLLKLMQESRMSGKIVLIVEDIPLNSLQVRGKVKDLVYQVVNKTGTQYTRKFKKSRNPQTPLQQSNRSKMKDAQLAWHSLSVAEKAVWNKKAKNMSKSGYNLFVSHYLSHH